MRGKISLVRKTRKWDQLPICGGQEEGRRG